MPQSPRLLRPANNFTPKSITGLALWLDASDASSLYTTDAGAVAAVSAPTDIAGCALWLDASDSSTITHTGGAVSEWRDKTTNGRHYTASTTARPSTGTRTQNGLNVIDFDGVNHQMSGNAASLSLFRNVSSGHVFVVAKMDTTAANQFIFSSSTASAPHITRAQVFVDGSGNLSIGGRRLDADGLQYITVSSVPTVPTVLSAHFDWANSDLFFRREGAVVSSLTTFQTDGSTSDTNGLASALGGAGAGFRLDGYIAEIIVFNAAITSAQRASVEAYLAAKWGISGVHAPATATSDPVGAWLDKSGNARHLTQASSSARPTLLPAGVSSKPAINFDGTDDNIWRQPGLTSDDLSILMVHQTNALSGGVTYEFSHSNDTTNSQASNLTGFGNCAGLQVSASGSPAYMCDVTRSFTQVDSQGRSGTAGDITANVPALSTQCVSYSATASAIRKQAWTSGKGMLNSGRFNCGGWSAITLGARRNTQSAGGINSPTIFLNGRIAEVIAYSRYISDTERRRLELYLARKWNVTLTGAPTVSNPEAQDWIDRVYGNGGSVSSGTAAAVNTLCQSITDAGIRDRFYRLNLFCGTGLNAALTPLYLGPTPLGIRYGNTTDTNVGPFVSGDYAETGASGGLVGNGTSKYLNTGVPGNAMAVGNRHLSAYEITRDTGAYKAIIGTQDNGSGTYFYALENLTPGTTLSFHCGSQATLASQSSGAHWIGSDRAADAMSLYKNGASAATSSGTNKNSPSVQPILVFALNQVPGSVSPAGYSSSRLGGYSMGLSLSDAQAAAYYSAMQTFQTALGRNV